MSGSANKGRICKERGSGCAGVEGASGVPWEAMNDLPKEVTREAASGRE